VNGRAEDERFPGKPENAMVSSTRETLVELENKFWNSLVEQDADTAIQLLTEPSLMVSGHGAMQFDHAGYRKMAQQGSMVLRSFELSNMQVMFPNDSTAVLTYHVKQEMAPRDKSDGVMQEMNDSSTWIKDGKFWKCVMHTETPANGSSSDTH
jgi:hypothetical protein